MTKASMYSVTCASAKDWGDDRIVDKIISSISDTENTKIALKTDGQPALVQVQDRIISVRTQPTIPENPPAYDPQANGGAERGVQEVKGQLKGNQIGIGGRNWRGNHGYHGHFGVDDPAGCGYDKQVLGCDDGRTAHYRVRHKNIHGKVFEFGGQVLAKPKRSNKQVKKKGALEPRFHDATWVGYNDRSNEHIVVLKEGGPAIKVRTVSQKQKENDGARLQSRTSWRRQTCPTRRMTARKTPGANAIRDARTLVLREGSFFQSSV